MNEWFIKIFRSLINWEWYDDINTCRLFIHLLLKVNYINTKWRWIEIKKGERLTSYWNLSSEIGISVMQIRTCLKKLKSTGEITIKTTNNYTLIKLNNYDKYNWDNTQVNNPITNEQQTDNNQITTNKESKNIKKEKNNKIYREFKHLKLFQEEFDRINIDYSKERIDCILDDIENRKKNTGVTSLNLTVRKWLRLADEKNNNSKREYQKSWKKDYIAWYN